MEAFPVRRDRNERDANGAVRNGQDARCPSAGCRVVVVLLLTERRSFGTIRAKSFRVEGVLL